MKTSQLIRTLGLGSALALIAGITNSAYAGPGPQYWQQMEQLRAANAARKAAVKTDSAKPAAMACAACKTSIVTEYSTRNVSGKFAPHFMPVGTKHECAACVGAITKVRGKTTNEMKANCPTCAKAGPGCCSV